MVTELERFGCNNEIVSFILPLGYSFNLDGSMMYMTFASIFIAQIYGIDMTVGQQITMLLVLMLTSKRNCRSSRAVGDYCSDLFYVWNSARRIALILPIDHFCDMGKKYDQCFRKCTRYFAVSKWEGQLDNHGGRL
ncbi:MAG: cation:dicarboxylase symporter family transporter [Cloacibacterium normanense]